MPCELEVHCTRSNLGVGRLEVHWMDTSQTLIEQTVAGEIIIRALLSTQGHTDRDRLFPSEKPYDRVYRHSLVIQDITEGPLTLAYNPNELGYFGRCLGLPIYVVTGRSMVTWSFGFGLPGGDHLIVGFPCSSYPQEYDTPEEALRMGVRVLHTIFGPLPALEESRSLWEHLEDFEDAV